MLKCDICVRSKFFVEIIMLGFTTGIVLNIVAYSICITTGNISEDNQSTKDMIEKAGCPYSTNNQLLVRDVCLLPNYENNQMPIDANDTSLVNITLFSAIVMEVDDRRHSLTIKLTQFFEWYEPRIRYNTAAKSGVTGVIWLSKKNINDIWHPDLDMYTDNLEEWKSFYDNAVYGKVGILNIVPVSEKNVNDDEEFNTTNTNSYNLSLGALKAWTAKFRCVFDFSSYPFDTHQCKFIQFGIEGMKLSLKQVGNQMEWNHEIDGFEIEIKDVGTLEKDQVGFNIVIKRIVEPYFYQYYLPCMAIVVVSLVSFLIPLSAIPGRVALTVTQFLTLTNIFMHQIVSRY